MWGDCLGPGALRAKPKIYHSTYHDKKVMCVSVTMHAHNQNGEYEGEWKVDIRLIRYRATDKGQEHRCVNANDPFDLGLYRYERTYTHCHIV